MILDICNLPLREKALITQESTDNFGFNVFLLACLYRHEAGPCNFDVLQAVFLRLLHYSTYFFFNTQFVKWNSVKAPPFVLERKLAWKKLKCENFCKAIKSLGFQRRRRPQGKSGDLRGWRQERAQRCGFEISSLGFQKTFSFSNKMCKQKNKDFSTVKHYLLQHSSLFVCWTRRDAK